jgi:murein DD-endopeptidase MepM/ murein hydrolase activator NlpD
MNLLVLLTALTAIPGQAVYLSVPEREGAETVSAVFEEQQVQLAATDDGWFALLGVDLDVSPGTYAIQLSYEYQDGEIEGEALTLEVLPKDYPTTKLEVAPKYVELSKENQTRSANERTQIRQAYAETRIQPYWSDRFIIPIPGVEGGRNFGHRRVFNEQPRSPHSGADLTAATGTEILAANSGKVLLTGDFFFNGQAVFIDHGMGVLTMYLHLSEILVEDGQMVERGELIGLAGATGRVTGPHLHWGAKVGGARVDPFSLPGIAAETAE